MDEQGEPADRDGRVRPQGLFSALSSQLPENAILSSDSGSAANWYARHIRIRRGMKAMLSGNLATMVPGVPYAIAAKFAYPDRVSVAMVGDGAMQMGGMAEMLTAAKYYKTWSDPRLVVLVLNNEDLNQVTWEQRVMEGDPEFEASQEIPYLDYAAYAELIGLHGIKVSKSSEIEERLARGAERRPPGDHQRADRSQRAAAAAAHHLRTGREVRQVDSRRSAGRPPRSGGVGAREGPRVPPGTLRCACAADEHRRVKARSEHRIDRWVANIEHGRFERSLSALTAFAALRHHRGGVRRALPGELRQQDDVEPDRRHAAGGGRWHRRRVQQTLGQDRAADRLGASTCSTG